MFGNKSSMYSGGADIEINFFRYLGLQIGFEIFQDEDKPQGEAKPIITQTILQIPVLARITLFYFLYYLSGYGGIGINLSPFSSNDAVIQSPSKLSLVAGGEFGIYMEALILFVGYQFNRDFSETAYSYKNNNFNYLGQRSMITFGIRYSMPFRKK